jgi:hypothetical protein
MKRRYFLPLLTIVYFLLVSLFLQNCGGSYKLPIQGEEEPSSIITIAQEEKEQMELEAQVSIIEATQKQESSTLPTIMPELWQYIFSYLDFKGVLSARAVNSDWNKLITGYRQAGIVGVENKPCHIIDTRRWTKSKAVDFRDINLKTLTPTTIPSFAFFHLIENAEYLPKVLFPYLKETNIHTLNFVWADRNYTPIGAQGTIELAKYLQVSKVHTLNLRGSEIGAQGAEALAKHLQGTKLYRLDLSGNRIGAQGAIQIAQHLQGTNIHTLNLGGNLIHDEGVIQVVQYLQGTCVHTLNLSDNQISDTGAIRLARHLQGTNIHILDLLLNPINDEGVIGLAESLQGTKVRRIKLGDFDIGTSNTVQQLLKEQYPYIRWMFY